MTLMFLSDVLCIQPFCIVPIAQGNFEFLVAVTQNCQKLEFLSLASLARLSHSGNVVLLQKALSHCHQLRDFR